MSNEGLGKFVDYNCTYTFYLYCDIVGSIYKENNTLKRRRERQCTLMQKQ